MQGSEGEMAALALGAACLLVVCSSVAAAMYRPQTPKAPSPDPKTAPTRPVKGVAFSSATEDGGSSEPYRMQMAPINNNTYYVTSTPSGLRVMSAGPGNLQLRSDMCERGENNRPQHAVYDPKTRKYMLHSPTGKVTWAEFEAPSGCFYRDAGKCGPVFGDGFHALRSVANGGAYVLHVEPSNTNPGNVGKFVRSDTRTNMNPNNLQAMARVCVK